MEVVPSEAPLGREIRGLDLRRLDDAGLEGLREAFCRWGVVYVRSQHLSPDEQVAFTRRIGELAPFKTDRFSLPGRPEIFVVSNIVEDGRPIGMVDAGEDWHSDGCFTEEPPWASVMCAVEVPERDGEPLGGTWFASTAAAWDALPTQMQARLDGLEAVNSYAARAALAAARGREAGASAALEAERRASLARWPDVVHPLVRRHPFTGRPALYVSPMHTVRIEGMPEAESAALVAELKAHVTRPEFVYRHRWQPGDVLLWDNAQSIHKAIFDYRLPERRRMHRTTIRGSCPR